MLWILVAIASIVAAQTAGAQPAATFTGLGFPEGSNVSDAVDVSADGSIVLGSYPCPFFWTAATGPVCIAALPYGTKVHGLSADGSVVVGRTDALGPGFGNPMRWTAAGGVELLGALPPDPNAQSFGGAAEAASADGSVVVGRSSNQAFRWTAATGMVALGGLPDVFRPYPYGAAVDVSADGSVIVGEAGNRADSPGSIQAFRWTASGGMEGLGYARRHFTSFAFAVSADGSVVVGNSVEVGFRWTPEADLDPLGQLPGFEYTSARDVSGDGSLIVGVVADLATLQQEAVIWHASTGVQGLARLLREQYGLDLSDWSLRQANAISSDGHTIVGDGHDPPDPQGQGWRVTLALRCANGLDDDGDGATDFPDDAGCASGLDATESVDCANGADDDGDGLVDTADPGCTNAADGAEVDATGECDDHDDNDRDGLIDFPTDVGCTSFDDASEFVECEDGIDNDADGHIDLDDPGCPFASAATESPACDDGADNDGDGAIDFADPGCAPGWPYWESAPCGLGGELALALPVPVWLRRRLPRRSS